MALVISRSLFRLVGPTVIVILTDIIIDGVLSDLGIPTTHGQKPPSPLLHALPESRPIRTNPSSIPSGVRSLGRLGLAHLRDSMARVTRMDCYWVDSNAEND